jgi:hypothetical protein
MSESLAICGHLELNSRLCLQISSRLSGNLRKSLHTGVSSEFCTAIKLTDYMSLQAGDARAIGDGIAVLVLIAMALRD